MVRLLGQVSDRSVSPLSIQERSIYQDRLGTNIVGKTQQKDCFLLVHEIDGVSGEPVAVKDDAPDIPGLQLLFAPGEGRLFVFS